MSQEGKKPKEIVQSRPSNLGKLCPKVTQFALSLKLSFKFICRNMAHAFVKYNRTF